VVPVELEVADIDGKSGAGQTPGLGQNSVEKKEANMQQRATKVNPSEETINVGSTGDSIRFLLTGDDSNGSVSVFEVLVPGGHKVPAPAHKNNAYEEVLYGIEGVLTWTVDGTV
jgi:quercetin dioxygenase-like cupin family protein